MPQKISPTDDSAFDPGKLKDSRNIQKPMLSMFFIVSNMSKVKRQEEHPEPKKRFTQLLSTRKRQLETAAWNFGLAKFKQLSQLLTR